MLQFTINNIVINKKYLEKNSTALHAMTLLDFVNKLFKYQN